MKTKVYIQLSAEIRIYFYSVVAIFLFCSYYFFVYLQLEICGEREVKLLTLMPRRHQICQGSPAIHIFQIVTQSLVVFVL